MSKLKSQKFRFLSDVATADLAFEAYGKDYSELFENAAYALQEATVSLKSIKEKETSEIYLSGKSPEELLLSFLEELIFLKDTKLLAFKDVACKVDKKADKWELRARLIGGKLDPKVHRLGADVKAVTRHLFEIKRLSNRTYMCRVVLDV